MAVDEAHDRSLRAASGFPSCSATIASGHNDGLKDTRLSMDWIPAVTTTGLLGLALWLFRSLISERLKGSVRHEFDVKMEQLRSEMRIGEDRAAAIRDSAMAAIAAGHDALVQRRLKAIDELWARTVALSSGRSVVSAWFGVLKIDELAKHANDRRVQDLARFVESLGFGFAENLKSTSATSARLYVSAEAWLLYEAYSSIVALALVQIQAVKAGVDPVKFTKTKETLELVRAALPEFSKRLDDFGFAAFAELLPDIEERLLRELRASAGGRDSDPESVARAAVVGKLLARREAERVREEAGLQA